MSDNRLPVKSGQPAGSPADALGPSAADLTRWRAALALASPALHDADRIDRIRLLDELKSAAGAAQAREAVAFKESQLKEQMAARVPARDVGKGIGAQVALARRESPHRAARLMGLAQALVDEMPQTLAHLAAGDISEWRATIVVHETACLSREHRALVDKRLADRLGTLSDGQVHAETRRHAYELDPYAALDRARRAVEDRRVTLRPAPDTMTFLSGLLPVVQGVAVYAALKREADTCRAHGDPAPAGR